MARALELAERFVSSRPGAWFFVNVAMRIDRVLMPLTRGRLRMSLSTPSGLLKVRGAKSGAERVVPLLYVPLGDGRVVLIASNGGNVRHPAWYHNLRANPDVRFAARGAECAYHARVAVGSERTELWRRAMGVYSGFDVYQARTDGREIPVVVLEPSGSG